MLITAPLHRALVNETNTRGDERFRKGRTTSGQGHPDESAQNSQRRLSPASVYAGLAAFCFFERALCNPFLSFFCRRGSGRRRRTDEKERGEEEEEEEEEAEEKRTGRRQGKRKRGRDTYIHINIERGGGSLEGFLLVIFVGGDSRCLPSPACRLLISHLRLPFRLPLHHPAPFPNPLVFLQELILDYHTRNGTNTRFFFSLFVFCFCSRFTLRSAVLVNVNCV